MQRTSPCCSPTRQQARIRLRSFRIKTVEPMDGNGFRVTSEATVEIEGQERPALVAEIIGIQYA